jgi:hypothetical protein
MGGVKNFAMIWAVVLFLSILGMSCQIKGMSSWINEKKDPSPTEKDLNVNQREQTNR